MQLIFLFFFFFVKVVLCKQITYVVLLTLYNSLFYYTDMVVLKEVSNFSIM